MTPLLKSIGPGFLTFVGGPSLSVSLWLSLLYCLWEIETETPRKRRVILKRTRLWLEVQLSLELHWPRHFEPCKRQFPAQGLDQSPGKICARELNSANQRPENGRTFRNYTHGRRDGMRALLVTVVSWHTVLCVYSCHMTTLFNTVSSAFIVSDLTISSSKSGAEFGEVRLFLWSWSSFLGLPPLVFSLGSPALCLTWCSRMVHLQPRGGFCLFLCTCQVGPLKARLAVNSRSSASYLSPNVNVCGSFGERDEAVRNPIMLCKVRWLVHWYTKSSVARFALVCVKVPRASLVLWDSRDRSHRRRFMEGFWLEVLRPLLP